MPEPLPLRQVTLLPSQHVKMKACIVSAPGRLTPGLPKGLNLDAMTRLACHLLLCLGLLLTQQAWSLSQMPMATHAGLPTDTTDVSAACPHHDPESPAALAQADTAGTCHDGGGATP